MNLPPLPFAYQVVEEIGRDMQAYATAAIEAYRARLIEGIDLTDAIGADLWVKGRVETLIAAAVLRERATERERCARICEETAERMNSTFQSAAAAIRKGETE